MQSTFTSAKSVSLFFILSSIQTVFGAPPPEPQSRQYSKLWLNSPFTIKVVAPPPKAESPLERDWMLGSIRPSGDGHAVTLINKKDRKDRVRFMPGIATKEYKLLKVEQNPQDSKKSRVQIQKGTQTAWISYDFELAKVRAASPSKKPTQTKRTLNTTARPPIPGRTTNANQGSSSKGSTTGSTRSVPRTRAVPRRSGNGG